MEEGKLNTRIQEYNINNRCNEQLSFIIHHCMIFTGLNYKQAGHQRICDPCESPSQAFLRPHIQMNCFSLYISLDHSCIPPTSIIIIIIIIIISVPLTTQGISVRGKFSWMQQEDAAPTTSRAALEGMNAVVDGLHVHHWSFY